MHKKTNPEEWETYETMDGTVVTYEEAKKFRREYLDLKKSGHKIEGLKLVFYMEIKNYLTSVKVREEFEKLKRKYPDME